jgi:dihydroorotate dehydrogenase
MYRILRPLLFQLDPERAHHTAVTAAQIAERFSPGIIQRLFAFEDPKLEQSCLGLTFPNPIGLAAGFDKNARLTRFCERLGFGFTEVGSVTHLPSTGNPRPRAFRLPEDRAVINRMGLNNEGAHAVAQRIALAKNDLQRPLGINIAKTHDPSILGAKGIRDFCSSFNLLAPLADYVTLNISCPNTREGTTFEDPETFRELAGEIAKIRATVAENLPILVKFSPPNALPIPDDHPVAELIDISRAFEFDGFVATNTASNRNNLGTSDERLEGIGAGGLSGAPLQERSAALIRFVYDYTDGALPIIGVGGIDSVDAAYQAIRAGASLLQVYTGLVYEGPGLVKHLKQGLVDRLETDGFSSLTEAVGRDAAHR